MVKYADAPKSFAEDVLKIVKEAANKLGVSVTTIHVPDALPAATIIETAQSAASSGFMQQSGPAAGVGGVDWRR